MSDDDQDRLPPAHSNFTAHFRHTIYDPDNDENDDLAPFGNDEGWDEVHDWADRLDDLRAHPTLRHMLGEGADEQIEQLRQTRQIDVDDIVIGLGFTLLRFTGQIDDEGRGWLLEALQRQGRSTQSGEYSIMLQDLTNFS